MKHKHYHLIVEWADGKRIQQKLYNKWIACDKPSWNENSEYRVDPDPVPDFAVSARVMFSDLNQGVEFAKNVDHNVEFLFDGDTHKLKALRRLKND